MPVEAWKKNDEPCTLTLHDTRESRERRIPALLTPFGRLGDQVIYILEDLGAMGIFLLQMCGGVFRPPFRFREALRQLHFIGAGSVAVIFFTALASGMVLGLQGYYSLHKFGAEGMLGSAVALTLIMELGPMLTALMVTGRVGSAMCAELGIMRITEQIDALDCMAVDPFRYLISPKLVAALISSAAAHCPVRCDRHCRGLLCRRTAHGSEQRRVFQRDDRQRHQP